MPRVTGFMATPFYSLTDGQPWAPTGALVKSASLKEDTGNVPVPDIADVGEEDKEIIPI